MSQLLGGNRGDEDEVHSTTATTTWEERQIRYEFEVLVARLKTRIKNNGGKRRNKILHARYEELNAVLVSNDYELMREIIMDKKISEQLEEERRHEKLKVKVLSVMGPSESAAMQQAEFSKALRVEFFPTSTKFGNGTMDRFQKDGVKFEMYHIQWKDFLMRRQLFANCFSSPAPDIVVFSASLASYDEVVTSSEGGKRNQMVESLSLLRSLYEVFPDSNTYVLLLTDKETFAEKLQTVDIASTQNNASFEDYSGGKDVDRGIIYFIDKFLEVVLDSKANYPTVHVIDKHGSESLDEMFELIRQILMREGMRRAGFLASD